LPIVGRDLAPERRIVTIPLSGRPEGMTGAGNTLLVTLSTEDRVAIIDTETLTVVGQITVTGNCPHTAILAGATWISAAP
jgi:YVTN family beta-propeller protein